MSWKRILIGAGIGFAAGFGILGTWKLPANAENLVSFRGSRQARASGLEAPVYVVALAVKLFSTTAAPIESPQTFTAVLKRSRSQSTDRIKPMYSTGKPTALRTITMVTRPASGIPAAPIAAIVAVTAITSWSESSRPSEAAHEPIGDSDLDRDPLHDVAGDVPQAVRCP